MFIKVFQGIMFKVPFPCSAQDIELSSPILLNSNCIEFISWVLLQDGLFVYHFHTQSRTYYYLGFLSDLEHVNL